MHEFIDDLKNQGQGGYFSPEQKDRALNAASSDKFNQEKRRFEESQYISDNLNPFQKYATVTLTSGFGPLPADYDYATNAATISVTASLDKQPIDIVREAEWVNRINDPISAPSAAKPVLILRSTIEIVPSSLTSFRLYYLRKPVDMVFGYTESGGDYIYSVGTSVNSDWPDSCHVDLCLRALTYLGVPLNDDMLVRLKAYKQQTEGV